MGEPDSRDDKPSVGAYWSLVKKNKLWRTLWIGEIINSTGGWFNYVATLQVIENLAGGSATGVSGYIIVRVMPFLIFFMPAGVVADRYERVTVLMWACILDAVFVAMLPIVQRPQEVWLLYVLAFLQFTMSAFYEPAKRALTPLLVAPEDLHLATTLDSFAWSLMGAVGASLGGWFASRFGTAACFGLDACSYLVAALCAVQLKGKVPTYQGDPSADDMRQDPSQALTAAPPPAKPALPDLENSFWDEDGRDASRRLSISAAAPVPDAHGHRDSSIMHASSREEQLLQHAADSGQSLEEAEGSEGLGEGQPHSRAASAKSRASAAASLAEPPAMGCLALVAHSLKDEIQALRDGCSYLSHGSNRDVIWLVMIKASGALIWMAADVLNVKFSEMQSMQLLGDQPFTLGLIFASVGFGCFLGPIVFNYFTPPRTHFLLRGVVGAYALLFVGYLLMVLAPDIFLVLLSTAVRSCGSAVVWVYSTLLLQIRVPNHMLGRMMAVEMASFTIADSASGLFAGVAFDGFDFTVRGFSVVMVCLAAIVTGIWSLYAWRAWQRHERVQAGGTYELAVTSDEGQHLLEPQ